MNNVDKQYLDLLKDILENGTEKNTRAGLVKSVFGRMMRFNLKEGFPIITTKKVFVKGVIHELLWFLKGKTNIYDLLVNNVHIWDGDAYRWYVTKVKKQNEVRNLNLEPKTKEEFLECVLRQDMEYFYTKEGQKEAEMYIYGDLGPIYGKQWRSFGVNGIDQIQRIIDTLNKNPDDRRMLCVAFNPDVIDEASLPPCHVMFQFYTKELENGKRELCCMWSQRSVDCGLGWSFNLVSYSILTHIIAEICNMEVGEIICSLGDCHIYLNQLEGITEQLSRDPYKYDLPKLSFTRELTNVDDLCYGDIKLEGYESYPAIKMPLSVG